MLNTSRRVRSLRVESLETRSLLAGNVTAAISGGVLKITGDSARNGVQISSRQTASGTQLLVGGTTLGGSPTTINGKTDLFVASGTLTGVEVKLSGGGDFLLINNTSPTGTNPPVPLPGTVNIDLGDGFDRFTGRFTNQTLVTLSLGAGNDKADIRGSTASGLTILADPLHNDVNPSAGNDTVYLNNVRCTTNLAINTYDGDDNITIVGKAPSQDVSIDAGQGNDHLDILGGPSLSLSKLTVAMDTGDDTVNLQNVVVTNNVSVQTDFGVFEGADSLTLTNVRAAAIFAVMGHGNDQVTVKSSKANSASFDGGDQIDAFVDGGSNDFPTFAKSNFES